MHLARGTIHVPYAFANTFTSKGRGASGKGRDAACAHRGNDWPREARDPSR